MKLTTFKFAQVAKSCAMMTAVAFVLAGCGSANDLADPSDQSDPSNPSNPSNPGNPSDPNNPIADGQEQTQSRVVLLGTDNNNIGSAILSLNPDGPGGSPNQSLRSGDVLQAGTKDSVMIGGLGIDVLIAGSGNDVMIGGTEDFNSSVDGDDRGSDNRDRAFGGLGDDMFIWAPGDGSDFFDGGPGIDVITFGVLGEERDSDGSTNGAPFFNVNPPGSDGSGNFDGIYLDPATYLPTVSVSTSPGFCTVLDKSTNPVEIEALSLDQLVRFSLRGVANAFDAGERTDDDGLRVSLSLRNVEYLVCTKREVVDGGGVNNIEVLNISTYPPTLATLADLPGTVQQQIQ